MSPGTPHPAVISRDLAVLRHSFRRGRNWPVAKAQILVRRRLGNQNPDLPTPCGKAPTGAGCACSPLRTFVPPASCRLPFLQLSTINSDLSTLNTHPPCFQTLAHSLLTTQNIAQVFSYTYKLFFPQTLYFDIITNCRGCHPLGAAKKEISAIRTRINFSSFMLLRAFLRASNIQLSWLQLLPHSFTKTPGWGVCSRNS
jgi:hypothetical protein